MRPTSFNAHVAMPTTTVVNTIGAINIFTAMSRRRRFHRRRLGQGDKASHRAMPVRT
jgi:hypothetical protein